jgi:hypothetical protein
MFGNVTTFPFCGVILLPSRKEPPKKGFYVCPPK